MASDLVFQHDCIILDACCIINLYCSGYMEEILESIPKAVAVATYVHDEEIKRFSLEPVIQRGLLRVVAPNSEEENELFVNLASQVEDGEAVTAAIAISRNWAIGTDDHRAVMVINKTAKHLQVISSLALIKHWADESQQPVVTIRGVLQNVKNHGRYEPHPNHALYHWWMQNELKRDNISSS